MTPTELLIAAKAKIDTPSKWTQGYLARNSSNNRVSCFSPRAVCFCSSGALMVAEDDNNVSSYTTTRAQERLVSAMGGSIPDFNDSHTHSQVMAAWDKAIENVRSQTVVSN